MDLWEIERGLDIDGLICGVDEAGRGPLAGPVCAAAVILPPETVIEGLNDSKRLTEKRREALYDVICQTAVAYGIAMASEQEIDELNILQATFLAMRRAVEQLQTLPAMVLVDGNRDPGLGISTQTVVGGDGKSANIAAASILAKVTRDRYMMQLAADYPAYGFEIHKGYGTKRHYDAILEHGVAPVHRRSFLKNLDAHRG